MVLTELVLKKLRGHPENTELTKLGGSVLEVQMLPGLHSAEDHQGHLTELGGSSYTDKIWGCSWLSSVLMKWGTGHISMCFKPYTIFLALN